MQLHLFILSEIGVSKICQGELISVLLLWLRDEDAIFEHTCAYAWWALMHRFPSIRCHLTKTQDKKIKRRRMKVKGPRNQ